MKQKRGIVNKSGKGCKEEPIGASQPPGEPANDPCEPSRLCTAHLRSLQSHLLPPTTQNGALGHQKWYQSEVDREGKWRLVEEDEEEEE